MSSLRELIIYYAVRIFGAFIRILPLSTALRLGRFLGMMAYFADIKHKGLAYANLRMVFASSKSPRQIDNILKSLFKNYGQNIIELLRLPHFNLDKLNKLMVLEGQEYIDASLKEGRGCILLAMHFGSWELASLSLAFLGYPYKVIVKPQNKYSKLDELLNSYRSCGGSVVLSREMGMRDFLKSLKNNEVIGMVVDQGGRDGVLVPFFSRGASMSVGAIRMGLKWKVPLCFAVVVREEHGRHRMIIHKPLELIQTGDLEMDVLYNLKKMTRDMEYYVSRFPQEYMWFYKIWKYSKETSVTILNDGKKGHLHQSLRACDLLESALAGRSIKLDKKIIDIAFKNKFLNSLFSWLYLFTPRLFYFGGLERLKFFLKEQSYQKLVSLKSDFIISCGSSTAGINGLLAKNDLAKSIVILRPSIFPLSRYDLAFVPQHDRILCLKAGRLQPVASPRGERTSPKAGKCKVAVLQAAPNLITEEYLQGQSENFLSRFPHLRRSLRSAIGILIGGDSKNVFLGEEELRILIHQMKETAQNMNKDLLVTTSRRTSRSMAELLKRELRQFPFCPLLIIDNEEPLPEGVGAIMSLADLLIVSGDSISMISEAIASGRPTIVFRPQSKTGAFFKKNKHLAFIDHLHDEGYIVAVNAASVGETVCRLMKANLPTKKLDDEKVMLEALRLVI